MKLRKAGLAFSVAIAVIALGCRGDESTRDDYEETRANFLNSVFDLNFVVRADDGAAIGLMKASNHSTSSELVLRANIDDAEQLITVSYQGRDVETCTGTVSNQTCASSRLPGESVGFLGTGDSYFGEIKVKKVEPVEGISLNSSCYQIQGNDDSRDVTWVECYAADGTLVYADGLGLMTLLLPGVDVTRENELSDLYFGGTLSIVREA